MPRGIVPFVLLCSVLLGQAPSVGQEQTDESRKLISRVVPVYPELARRLQLRGKVRVEAVVAPNGRVTSTRVVGGNPLLAAAAEQAVRQWKYAASPTESTALVELNFVPH